MEQPHTLTPDALESLAKMLDAKARADLALADEAKALDNPPPLSFDWYEGKATGYAMAAIYIRKLIEQSV